MRIILLTFMVASAAVWLADAAQNPAGGQTFLLPGRVKIELPRGWVERREIALPPPPLLAGSAPPLNFSEIAAFENRAAPAVLLLAVSDNPFEGLVPATLDTQLRGLSEGRTLREYLFFFFFPPPDRCLAEAAIAFDRARAREEAQRIRQADEDTPLAPARPVRVTHACQFGQTARDFFAERVSRSVTLRGAGHPATASGALEDYFLTPIEEIELSGHTFFLFEAQSQRDVDRPELDRFNLDENLRGTRAHFFWAIGAPSPFPFARDPLRKTVPLLHVVYAALGPSGDVRPRFRRLLESIEFTP